MAQLPTGTVTFLFSDIEGSTRLLQRLGGDYARVLGEHQALLRAAWAAHDGVEVDTEGDSFFVAFASAPAALAAAAAATRALAMRTWPEGSAVRVRVGLHTGAPQVVGDNYIGLDVHRAARIAAAGHGGQVLLSETTHALVEAELPAATSLRDLGPHRLKDLPHPEHLYQLVLPDLPADFPPLKSLDAHQHNLPPQLTPLLGREAQLAAVGALLRRTDIRLVTLTGPGGIGKTRLSIQVAAQVLDAFPDGVWFVRLSRLVDPALALPTIAQTLGLKEAGSQPIGETLREYLVSRRLLLVLDNFEQVVAAGDEVAGLLGVSPGLTVLVTSRIRLRLRGEREYPLGPLPLPDPGHIPAPERLSQYAAVALFVERAVESRPDFAITAGNAPAVAEICARLDGLPLAIELAAARVKILSPEALLGRLSGQLALLTGGARDLEERQRTMRATIAWSEHLLTPAERVLFRRLAVFVGGGALGAVEAVCVAPPGAEPLEMDVLEGLSALVDQSLVQQREEGGEPRFGMLHVIREYALERLEAVGVSNDRTEAADAHGCASTGAQPEAEALRRAHAAWVVDLVERAEPALTGPETGAWLALLEREHDNLRAALGWARDHGEVETGLRVAAAVWRFWVARGYLGEGRGCLAALLALDDGAEEGGAASATSVPARAAHLTRDSVRARALVAAGALAVWQGDFAPAASWLERAAALGRAAGDPRTTASALNGLGIIAREAGDQERASAHYTESLALYRQVGDERSAAVALQNLGDAAYYQGDLDRAEACFAEALSLLRQVGDHEHIAVCLENLGDVAARRGDLARAEALSREALALDRARGDLRRCAGALEHLASVAGAAGQGERAARLSGAASALRETLGAPMSPVERAAAERELAAARTYLGEERWTTAFAAGRALSLDAALAEALGETGDVG